MMVDLEMDSDDGEDSREKGEFSGAWEEKELGKEMMTKLKSD